MTANPVANRAEKDMRQIDQQKINSDDHFNGAMTGLACRQRRMGRIGKIVLGMALSCALVASALLTRAYLQAKSIVIPQTLLARFPETTDALESMIIDWILAGINILFLLMTIGFFTYFVILVRSCNERFHDYSILFAKIRHFIVLITTLFVLKSCVVTIEPPDSERTDIAHNIQHGSYEDIRELFEKNALLNVTGAKFVLGQIALRASEHPPSGIDLQSAIADGMAALPQEQDGGNDHMKKVLALMETRLYGSVRTPQLQADAIGNAGVRDVVIRMFGVGALILFSLGGLLLYMARNLHKRLQRIGKLKLTIGERN